MKVEDAMACRAVFLDRDGVLVIPTVRDGRSYAPTSLEQFEVYPDAMQSVWRLKQAGYRVVVVTNQPDVGAGRAAQSMVEEMHARLEREMPLDAIMVCYHTKDQNCDCRKPRTGLLMQAAVEMEIDLASSVMVGDRASDVEAGMRAGCRTVFIDRGYTAELRPEQTDRTVTSLAGATDWILSFDTSTVGVDA